MTENETVEVVEMTESHKFVKMAVRGVVVLGTYWTFKNVVENNIMPENRGQRIKGRIGAAAFGAMVADHSKEYADKWVDDAFRYVALYNKYAEKIDVSIKPDKNDSTN